MIYQECIQDLFSVSNSYTLAQCISADFAMGKGIALQFNVHFDIKQRLKSNYPDYLKNWNQQHLQYDCILENHVLNLVTKKHWRSKPTYQTIQGALKCMQSICSKQQITKIAMPLIGCGLDGLEWNCVSRLILDIFADTEMEILVCKQA